MADVFLYILVCLFIILSRITCSFDLTYMECGPLIQIIGILSGHKLYVASSIEIMSFIYPPFYFYASAAVASIVGVGFLTLRLVSFISSLGCFSLRLE